MSGSSTVSELSRTVAPWRWAGLALLGAAIVLLPWIVVLGFTLPTTASARHWSGAWIGFDVMETAGLAVTGWLVLRRDIRVTIAASATAAFLLSDAWFDTTTAQPRWDLLEAMMLALFVELPLAALCGAIAFSASRWGVDSGRRG